jgi:hypothetical protein
MPKKKIGELTVSIEPSGRGLKGSLFYEGGPYEMMKELDPVLAEVKGKTEAEVMKKAQDWVAKRTPRKILINCVKCRNGVELEKKTTKGVMQIHCNACGAVVYRGAPIDWT